MKKVIKNDREYWVAFEILTKLISLEKLSKNIGLDASEGSRTKGKKFMRNEVEKKTWFKFSSTLPDNAKLERHLDFIIKKIEKSAVFKKGILPKDSKLRISIAEPYDFNKRAYFQMNILEKYVTWCGKHNISIEVSVYPSFSESK